MEITSDFELIVHIGTGKTGSSSIQKSLARSKELLQENGVAYFGLMAEESPVKRYGWQVPGGWPDLRSTGSLTAAEQLSEILTDSIAVAHGQGCRAAIWSNETIFGNHELVIPILNRLKASGVKIKIIVYVRRHDTWARSAYMQWGIKHKTEKGPVKPFLDWYKSHGVRFASGLEPWLQQEYVMSVRNFDACGDVVVDFLSCCGLEHAGVVVRRENETPNALALALWAMYNSQFDEPVLPVKLQRMLRRAGLLDKALVDVDFNSLLPTQTEIDNVREDCRSDREQLNAILAKFGQLPIETADVPHKSISVSQGQVNAAFLLLLKQQSDEIANLQKKLRDISTALLEEYAASGSDSEIFFRRRP